MLTPMLFFCTKSPEILIATLNLQFPHQGVKLNSGCSQKMYMFIFKVCSIFYKYFDS